jgi:phospholipase/carboxylesterase
MGLVLVHGRGATAEGILDLGHALALPDLALVAPAGAGDELVADLVPRADASQMEPYVERVWQPSTPRSRRL